MAKNAKKNEIVSMVPPMPVVAWGKPEEPKPVRKNGAAEYAKTQRGKLVVFAHQRPNGSWFINEIDQSWGLTETKAERFATSEDAAAWAIEMGYDYRGLRPIGAVYAPYPGLKGNRKRQQFGQPQYLAEGYDRKAERAFFAALAEVGVQEPDADAEVASVEAA